MTKQTSRTTSASLPDRSRSAVAPAPSIQQVGVLVPVSDTAASAISPATEIPIDAAPTVIGHDPSNGIRLGDSHHPRKHALLYPGHGHCYVEDGGTVAGTFLNDTRVRACRLVAGDHIRFGDDSLWRFGTRWCAADEKSIEPRGLPPMLQSRSRDEFLVTFWGCRGSMPMSGPHMNAIGGQSTSIEIRYNDRIVLIDAGTGLFRLSQSWREEFGKAPLDFHLFFTHLHWDHIQTFPFFAQAYQSGNRLRIHGATGMAAPIETSLRQLMQQHNFPVGMDAMKATFSFDEISPGWSVDGLVVDTFPVPHPGGSMAYRIQAPTGTFLFATDCELDHLAANRDAVEADQKLPREYPDEMLRFFRDVDLLVVDCQYSDEQYAARCGWGHNSVSSVIELCRQTRPGSVGLTHHDPLADDLQVAKNVETVRAALLSCLGEKSPSVFAAREEMTVCVSRPRETRR